MRKQTIIDFNLDPDLGLTIENKWPMAFGAAPIKEFKEIVFAAGGNKFSNLCGFKFITKAPTPYKEFFICFVTKLRSKIYKQQLTNPSQWFIFKRISGSEIHCLSKNELLVQYGFDINKFYQSDYFIKMLPKLISTVKRGVNVYIPEYVKQHGNELAIANLTSYDGDQSDTVEKCVGRYVNSIQDAIPFISDIRTNNKFYKLINLDVHVESDNVVSEASFDQYDWKNGSLTGKGLIAMILDSGAGKQNTLNAPIRIYDRSTNKYYNIIDSHLGKNNTGFMIEIDTRKEIAENDEKDESKRKIVESDGEWSIYARTLRSYDGYYFYADVHPNHFYTQLAAEEWKKTFLEEISNALEYWYGQTVDRHELYVNRASDIHNSRLISFSTAEFDPTYKKAWKEYQEELSNPTYGKGRGDDTGLREYDAAMRQNKRKIEQIYSLDKSKTEAECTEKELDVAIDEELAKRGIYESAPDTCYVYNSYVEADRDMKYRDEGDVIIVEDPTEDISYLRKAYKFVSDRRIK